MALKLEVQSDEGPEGLYIEAKALWLLGRFEEAIKKVNRLVLMGEGQEDKEVCARAFNLTGKIFFDLGNFEKTLENYTKALSLSKHIENKLMVGTIHNNMGELYSALGANDEALNYYTMALKTALSLGNGSLMGTIYLNLGDLSYKKKDLDAATRYANLSMNSLTDTENYLCMAKTHAILAKIYRVNKAYDIAYREIYLALDLMEKSDNKVGIVNLYEIIINFLLAEDKLSEALKYTGVGLEMATSLKLNNTIASMALLASKIYEKVNDFEKSLTYYKLYTEHKRLDGTGSSLDQKNKGLTQLNIEKLMYDKEIYRLKNIELKKKSEEIQQLYESVRVINNIGLNITSSLDIAKIMRLIYENINILMDASYFGIMLYDKEMQVINTNFFSESGEQFKAENISIEDTKSIVAWCIRNQSEIFSNDFESELLKYRQKDRHKNSTPLQSKSVIVLPLTVQNEIIGAVTVQSPQKDSYSNYHYNIFKALASYIAIAIKNSQESQKLEVEIRERIKIQKELEKLNKKLSELSYVDDLTKIANRRKFIEYFNTELIRAKRGKSSLALLLIDIDFFKEYNDNYGHVEGDKCISKVAFLLKKSISRKGDFVARYGGDEFVVVLTDTDEQGIRKVIEKMRKNIKRTEIEHKFSTVSDTLTITIGGIELIPKQAYTVDCLIHLADRALYKAKELGRNNYVIHNEPMA